MSGVTGPLAVAKYSGRAGCQPHVTLGESLTLNPRKAPQYRPRDGPRRLTPTTLRSYCRQRRGDEDADVTEAPGVTDP